MNYVFMYNYYCYMFNVIHFFLLIILVSIVSVNVNCHSFPSQYGKHCYDNWPGSGMIVFVI